MRVAHQKAKYPKMTCSKRTSAPNRSDNGDVAYNTAKSFSRSIPT